MPRRDTTVRKGGRPSALTPERARIIEASLRAGNHITTACAVAGTTTTSFYRWMERASRADYAIEHGQPWDRADETYRAFRDKVLAARASAADTMVDVVMRSALGGQLIEESVAKDGNGNPIKDNDGNPIIERKYTTPDGRLALSYLKVAQPEGWAGAPGRLELSGPGGTAIPINGGDGEPEGDDVSRLASRITAAIAQQAEHNRLALESSEPTRVDDDDLPAPGDVVEGEWTEEAPDDL
jgi:hypothetical protein